MRMLCEEVRRYPHIPSIQQYKDSQMCSNSGQLFVHVFVYCLLRMYVTFLHSGPPAYTFGSINTVDRVRAVCVRVQIEHAERITQPLDAKIAGSLRLLLFLASTFDHCFDKTLL